MDFVKNIATVVGCILTCASLFTLICKPIRKSFVKFVQSHAGLSETDRELAEIKSMLQQKIDDDKTRDKEIKDALAITMEFTEKQCRNIIKNIFYHYKDEKTLPLYEKKTLLDIEELYIDRMHKNHWGQTLINEMKTWATDCSGDEMSVLEEET